MDRLVIGTRGSKLALKQASIISELLICENPLLDIELKIIKTRGDNNLDIPTDLMGGKSIFTQEIEGMLKNESIDLAVHSLKDLPSNLSKDFLYLGSAILLEK